MRDDVGLALLRLLLSEEFSQDVWVLDVVRKRVGHRIVSSLLVDVEVVSG